MTVARTQINGRPSRADVAKAARAALAAGISILPPVEDGTKRPSTVEVDGRATWDPFQHDLASEEQLKGWYERQRRTGLGFVCGPVSGGLELYEFDSRATYDAFKPQALALGLGDLVERIENGYLEDTPGDGVHWFYYSDEVRGNTKLARRPGPPDDKGRPTVEVLIETRGEGGFAIVAPSFGRVHPTGRPYRLLRGGVATIVTITAEERDALWDLAKTFDEMPRDVAPELISAPPAPARPSNDRADHGLKPGDDFNARATWDEILTPHGWANVFSHGDTGYWRRPGRTFGHSATTNHGGHGLLHVFTSSSVFESEKSYSKFGAYARLNHAGDFSAAAKALYEQGYGQRHEKHAKENEDRRRPVSPAPPSRPEEVFGSAPPAPRPIRADLHPVPAFDPRLLPEPLRPWLLDIAERVGCSLAYVAVAAVVATATLVGRKVAIRPKRHDDWSVVANLWAMCVAPPGALKTPALEEALRLLRRLEAEAREQHARALEAFAVAKAVAQAQADAAKAALKKGAQKGLPEAALTRLAEDARNESVVAEPTQRRYILNDTTVEKLGEILRENPTGVLVFRDELLGLLKGLDKQGHESDRSFYLESWNGTGSFVYDRIGRGTVFVPSTTVSILGGIQPGPLARFIRAAASGEGDDGLISRFQLAVYPDQEREWRNVDRWPDAEAKGRAYAVFRALDQLDLDVIGATRDEVDPGAIPYLRFAPDAQEFFDAWRTDLEVRKLRSQHEAATIESHLAKYRSLMPSLALLFHLVDVAGGGCTGRVWLDSARLAAAWCDYLEEHARRIYRLAFDGDVEPAQRLADRLQQSLPNPFSIRQVVQKGWSSLATTEDVERAVSVLAENDWIKPVEVPPGPEGGRPKTEYWINPHLVGGGP